MPSTAARILVIEDHEDIRTLLDYLLRAHGHEPLLARSGPEGIETARHMRPAVILLDIRMPGMDGYEVVAALRAEPGLEQTRIIALTASAWAGDRERIAAAGFDGYVPKPIETEIFVAEIERFLREAVAS
jgi:CheY-like chemotaxis protein